MTNEQKERLIKAIEERFNWNYETNCWHCEIYSDYADQEAFEDYTLPEIIKSDNPRDRYYELINDAYMEHDLAERDEVFKEILETDISAELDETELYEFISDHAWIDYPDFTDTEIPVNVCINAGDDNYDGGCNNSVDHQYVEPYSGLAYLAEKQGYSLEQLNDFINDKIDTDSVFLKSAKKAWYDATQGGHYVYICTIMTVEEWFKFKEIQKLENPINDKWYPWNSKGQSYISITGAEKDEITWILINTSIGCVANLDGILEKDMDIPIHYILNIYPEINRGSSDTFSVQNICGVYTDWYAGKVTVNKVNNELLKEKRDE